MRKHVRISLPWCAGALAVAVVGTARAEDIGEMEETELELIDNPYAAPRATNEMGVALQVGGGVSRFAEQRANDLFDPAGVWNARLVLGTRMPLAIEAAYIGSASNVTTFGLADDAVVTTNGAEANLRWNILSGDLRPSSGFQPYVFGGIAFKRYSMVNESFNNSLLPNDDNVGEVPLGGGIAWMYRGFVADARGEYRYAFSDDFLTGVREDLDLHVWDVTARIGWEF